MTEKIEWQAELVEPKHPALHTKATLDPFESDVEPASAKTETRPTMKTPPRIKIIPTTWCLYCLRPRKTTDIRAVITTIKPRII